MPSICKLTVIPSAEGNPDEEKIGAFGVGKLPTFSRLLDGLTSVGFYSLFSITEEPFVTSGGAYLYIQLRSAIAATLHFRSMDGFLLEG